LLFVVPVVLGAIFVSFFLTRIVPGNPIDIIAGPYASDERVAEMKEEAGLNDPFYVQFWDYLRDLVRGDFGVSYNTTGQPIAQDLRERLPASAELVTYGMLLAIALALPLGIVSAVRRGSWIDHVARVIAVLGVSVPIFWIALVLLSVFYSRLGWLPGAQGRLPIGMTAPDRITGFYTIDALLQGQWQTAWEAVRSLTLPVVTIGLVAMAPIARMTRATMIEALESDYVRTSRSLGLPKRVIVLHHAFKNALLPVLTLIAAVFGFAIGGEVLVEYIFSWPGLGLYSYNAIFRSDYPAIQGFIIVATLIYVLIYLVVDVVTATLDPRVEF
jgi:peptide/nickel transport system permease protein